MGSRSALIRYIQTDERSASPLCLLRRIHDEFQRWRSSRRPDRLSRTIRGRCATPQERNAEIIRQWSLLRDIESRSDCTVDQLAETYDVCTRTIRRDLNALESAGFPLYQEPRPAGGHFWRLSGKPFRKLPDTAFTMSELCAFWANRTRLTTTGGSPIDRDLNSALEKVARSLSPHMKAYLDKLAAVVSSKPGAEPGGGGRGHGANVDLLVKATVDHRRVEMVYHSFSSRRVKTYVIEPHRLTFTTGGIYLYAYVPAYRQMRTFALQRIRQLRTLLETFNPVEVDGDPYAGSLGPYAGGTVERVEVEFSPAVAPYIEEREWHKSQTLERLDDGAVVLRLDVAIDFPLRSWILGFGHHARVLRPSRLAVEILEEHEEAREQYAPRMPFEADAAAAVGQQAAWLPFAPAGVAVRSQRPPREPSAPRPTAAPRRPGARRATR